MAKDKFTRTWITENAIEIVARYEPGMLTLRGLHYQLVAIGMTNMIQHYKRFVSAMIEARWNGDIDFEAFSEKLISMCEDAIDYFFDEDLYNELIEEEEEEERKQYQLELKEFVNNLKID